MIEVVSATRADQNQFLMTPLGLSLQRLRFDQRLHPFIAFANADGLPAIYNRRISAESESDILLFIHDDVWINDYFIADRVIDGLAVYDVIGVAGNRRIPEAHVGWLFKSANFEWDDQANLSGAVAHGKTLMADISHYGSWPATCELLDGVLLAARRERLVKAEVKFDELFTFDFYDLDFSRSARNAGLKLGAWPIAVTHNSGGAFGTPRWREALRLYRAKWP